MNFPVEKAFLYKKIGELIVENDILKAVNAQLSEMKNAIKEKNGTREDREDQSGTEGQ